ncbi:hypothetical protein BGZ65_008086 [Modicella reniformis]|uniref:Uncharacterized protein n=1 Tax=Modicella reniformis TaxID=1440133 RepID=A0A9P6LW89_9FUNG|nr:hypothetical protein BGZ65_008086 [Modicella reniformis]
MEDIQGIQGIQDKEDIQVKVDIQDKVDLEDTEDIQDKADLEDMEGPEDIQVQVDSEEEELGDQDSHLVQVMVQERHLISMPQCQCHKVPHTYHGTRSGRWLVGRPHMVQVTHQCQ